MINKLLQNEFNKNDKQISNIIEMFDKGDTVPFIARYRTELTGSMSSEDLFKLHDRLNYLRKLEARKESIIKSMASRGQLTSDLKSQIMKFDIMTKLEEFYEPFIIREDSPATKAKEKGLEIVANQILTFNDEDIDSFISSFSKEKGLIEDEVLEGAKDIILEQLIYDPDLKEMARFLIKKDCRLESSIIKKRKDDKSEDYKAIDKYSENIAKIPSHKTLAIFRGIKEKQVKIAFQKNTEEIINRLNVKVLKNAKGKYALLVQDLISKAYEKNIEGYIETEIKKDLFEKAEDRAIEVFSKNLKDMLLQKPVKNKTILGLDPGYVTGCKLSVIDRTGNLVDKDLIKPTPPHNKKDEAEKILLKMIKKNNIDLISIGNGTASQESELFVSELLEKNPELKVEYTVTSEQGASIYSASKEAVEEFPDLDIYFRSAISIARRVQDPLSELIKIDPKSIGVGQYQHDLSKTKLKTELDRTVTTCVNLVGVDVNTASVSLLQHIAGLNKKTASQIFDYKKEKGFIKSRAEIKKIKGIGEKTYNQCIGFLKVFSGENFLDEYLIHPEDYKIAQELHSGDKDKSELDYPEEKLSYIENEFKNKGRDIRETIGKELPKRSKIITFDDIKIGQKYTGTVRNVTDFGAFVDIGLHNAGLVHISNISDKFIKNIHDFISTGDLVDVYIIDINKKKEQIQLSILPGKEKWGDLG